MNHRKLVSIFATLLLLSGCDQLQTALNGDSADVADDGMEAAATSTSGGKVLAMVNGTEITQNAFNTYNSSRKPQPGGDAANAPETVLQELVSLELMRQEGLKTGINKRPGVVAMLDHQVRQTLASATINDFLKSNQPSDEEALETYNMQMAAAGKEYNARHILLETQEAAAEVITQLDAGADFSELAMEKSTGPSGKNGGKLGWFGHGRMVKPFSDATAALEAGSYTREPVKTRFGWHVILLDETRESTPPPFEDVKARLKMLMANQKLQKHIEQIKASAEITFNDE